MTNYDVLEGGKKIVAVFPPDARTPRPLPPPVPAGPEVIVSMDADRNRLRTFPSLMRTPYEHQLLEWHATGQIGVVDVATGAVTKFGKPAMITAVDMSPDARYARVTQMTKPFSFIVPTSSFGNLEEVWDSTGKALAEISKRNLNLGVQATPTDPPDPNNPQAPAQAAAGGGRAGGAGAADNGKRELTWRADGQGFNYLQLEPAPPAATNAGRQGRGGNAGGGNAGGDQAQAAAGAPVQAAGGTQDAQAAGGRGANAQANTPPRKDRLMQRMPPFSESSTKLIYEHPTRINGVRYSPDGQIMFFTEGNTTMAIYVSDMATKYTVARGGGGGAAGGRGGGGGGGGGGRGGGAGNDPVGSMMTSTGTVSAKSFGGGTPVIISPDGTSVYFQGASGGGRGANATPAKAFIDKVVIKTGEKTRLFEGENTGITETISTVIDPN